MCMVCVRKRKRERRGRGEGEERERERERERVTKTSLAKKLIMLQLTELHHKSYAPPFVGLLAYGFHIIKGIPVWQN